MKDKQILLICIGVIAITCIGAFAFLNLDNAQEETNSNITSANNSTVNSTNNVSNDTSNQKSSSDNSISQKPKTFGVCISCGKVVPGAYGRIRCAECQRAIENGEPIEDHSDESAAVTNPNGRVAGDGDHSDIYYNYEYKNL